MLLFLGISSYIGETRGMQDDEGNIIGMSKTSHFEMSVSF
jgi:hypothetical protein